MKELTYRDVEQMLRLIDQSNCEQVSLELGHLKLFVSRSGKQLAIPTSTRVVTAAPADAAPVASMPAPQAIAPELPAAESKADEPANSQDSNRFHVVMATMVGVFYASSSPEAEPFVKVGSKVAAKDTVCLLEVMKLFQSIPAGTDGFVKEVLVQSGTMVEYGTKLFVIERSTGPA